MSRTDKVLLLIAALCLVVIIVDALPYGVYSGALGIIGVVVGVVLAHVLSRLREKGRREGERDALLRLLSIEIAHNSSFLNFWLYTGPAIAISDELDALTIDTWKSERVRLAQFIPTELPQEDFDFLADYYRRLQHFMSYANSPGRRRLRETEQGASLLSRDTKKRLTRLETSRKHANEVINQYIEPTETSRAEPEGDETR
jgi:hypothetical protein